MTTLTTHALRWRWAPVVLVAATGLLSNGCGSDDNESSAKAGTTTTIRMAHTPAMPYMPVYVADAKGYFKKRGITMDFIQAADVNPLMAGGNVDMALNGATASIISAANGKPAPIAVTLQQRPSQTFAGRADLKVATPTYPESIRELRKASGDKMTIGVTSLGGDAYLYFERIMQGAGFKQNKDYSYVVLQPGPGLVAALKSKQVDASLLYPPFDAVAYQEGSAYPLIDSAKGEGPPDSRYGTGVQVTPGYLKSDPDAVKRFVAAVSEAQAFMRDSANLPELVTIAKKYTGVTDPEVLSASLPSIMKLAEPMATCERMKAVTDDLLAVKTIKTAPPCSDIIAQSVIPPSQ